MKQCSGLLLLCALLSACAGKTDRYGSERIGSLNEKKIKIEEPVIDDALDKALDSYRKFLTEAPETEATPEAMRRLADLQLEAGSGKVEVVVEKNQDPKTADNQSLEQKAGFLNLLQTPQQRLAGKNTRHETLKQKKNPPEQRQVISVNSDIMAIAEKDADKNTESQSNFENRVTKISQLPAATPQMELPDGMDREKAVVLNNNTEEAIKLYQELLRKYPLYERNDQVLYQLARAYEEGARQDEAMEVLGKLVKKYPHSEYVDESYFRRGEIYFVHKQYTDAELAYTEVMKFGQKSVFYDQALFKRGWSFFKQSQYTDALGDFIKLLDIKTAQGYHLSPDVNKTEYQRIADTFRVVSYSFSYLGEIAIVNEYFATHGRRDYEDMVYNQLGEYYLEKRRYQDAATCYQAFIRSYPLHKRAPEFHIQIMDIYKKGNFPVLVIDAKRQFAATYDLRSEYWTYHNINKFPKILDFIKENLVDLARHYHALSQKAKKAEDVQKSYLEAVIWYHAFLKSFADDSRAPELNFLLAEILFDNKNYLDAAKEYERTAYGYPAHMRAAESGYAAVVAYKENEQRLQGSARAAAHLEMIRSSLQFAETFSAHPEAPVVLTGASESLFALNEYERAGKVAALVISRYPNAAAKLLKSAWIVAGHAAFDLGQFAQAEKAYAEVLLRTTKDSAEYTAFNDRLAASVYKQAELHQRANELDAAVEDYLRVGEVAPDSGIRISAEYDAAGTLIELKKWEMAAEVLQGFRTRYPAHELQFEVTKKLAVVYQESGKSLDAAKEYDTISISAENDAIKKEAMLLAAELYEKAGILDKAIAMHERYFIRYPAPVESAMESMQKVSELSSRQGNQNRYFDMLSEIVKADRNAGTGRSDRTRYLAGSAALILTEPLYDAFRKVRLSEPFQKTLQAKKVKMQAAIKAYTDLVDYRVGEVTAAATYKIAGIYYQLSRDMLESERPPKLSGEELEQYELILEENAYPFEEKAIGIYEKNIELIGQGVYNKWIDMTLEQLSRLLPARYGKQEEGESYVQDIH